ncbi:Pfs, NACHT and WD domain protein [Purpureocillium lavendulum]|uniref:Pfs, NACHT and WD domain protein n=1 Tax=Purpureocillium lavendulum TaxID=1247861 RepID=A0AB34FBY7_9HYPO|nr:Pfs, NACHT and WD domain protein [Purpureocillium lavendulum]
MPAGTILLTPMSINIQCQRKRPWQQNDVSRKGLPCAAAFACTDYQVQGRTLERVALELRGAGTTKVDGHLIPSQGDPYSLYVHLSRCRTLDGVMLVSKVRERDLVGNRVPVEMTAAQDRRAELCDRTIREALSWFGDGRDSQERQMLSPRTDENTKSGRDDDVAALSDTAYGTDKPRPEMVLISAEIEAQGKPNPLEASGAIQEFSKPRGDERAEQYKVVVRKAERSRIGDTPRKGGMLRVYQMTKKIKKLS